MIDFKALRAALNWSQEQMAEFLGCDQATVYRMERGQEPTGGFRRVYARLDHIVEKGLVLPDMPVADAIAIATFGRLPPVESSPSQLLQPESA